MDTVMAFVPAGIMLPSRASILEVYPSKRRAEPIAPFAFPGVKWPSTAKVLPLTVSVILPDLASMSKWATRSALAAIDEQINRPDNSVLVYFIAYMSDIRLPDLLLARQL